MGAGERLQAVGGMFYRAIDSFGELYASRRAPALIIQPLIQELRGETGFVLIFLC